MLRVKVHNKKVLKALKDLRRSRYPKATAEALNKTAFEIRIAEGKQVRRSFSFKSGSTESFLGSEKSFVFNKATSRRLNVQIFPRPKANQVLFIHEKGGRVVQSDERTLTVGRKIAVPVGLKFGGRGRIRKSDTPAGLLSQGKGFVTRNQRAIIKRRAKQTSVAYALIDSFQLKPRLQYFNTAFRTAQKVFAAKAERALDKFKVGKL